MALGKFVRFYSVLSWKTGSIWLRWGGLNSPLFPGKHIPEPHGRTSGCWDLAVLAHMGLAHRQSPECRAWALCGALGICPFCLGLAGTVFPQVTRLFLLDLTQLPPRSVTQTPPWAGGEVEGGLGGLSRSAWRGWRGCTRQASPQVGTSWVGSPKASPATLLLGGGSCQRRAAALQPHDFRPRETAVPFLGLWLTQHFHRGGGSAVENQLGAWTTRPSARLPRRLAAKSK